MHLTYVYLIARKMEKTKKRKYGNRDTERIGIIPP
jgi:hypothetical protein